MPAHRSPLSGSRADDRSRSPLRLRPSSCPSAGSAGPDAVPAPDADSLQARESGPLPIMPDEPERLPRYIEHTVLVGGMPVTALYSLNMSSGPYQTRLRGLYDVGAYSRELWSRIEWEVADLIALSNARMLQTRPPTIDSPTKLWAVRGQVLPSLDRLAILRNQMGAMADDEMRFHMNSLAEECLRGGDCLPKQVVVIDPLVSAAWVDPAAFDCAEWAATHPEILADGLQAIGVFCIEAHWIPFLITPWGNTVRIASFDAAQELPAMLSACLMRMTHGLGFTETFFDHVVRPFAIKSACGAVAINFLRAQLVGFPRLCSNVSAWEEHHCLRRRFMQHIGNSTEVPRPWFWGNGPPSGGNLGSESGLPGPASSSPSCATDVALGPAVSVGAPGSSAQVAQEVVDALACVPSDGLGALKGPTFMTSQQYAAVRSQMLASDDRRNLLAGQYGIWADDEIRFHLQALADQCNVVSNDQLVRHVRVVDPLITLSWTLQGSMSATDSARLFRFACTEQVILVGTLKVREHWVPFLLFPAGSRVRIVTGDYQAEIPAQWINCLIEFAFALGFQSLRFDHTRRDIRCRSACGAVAINFVGCQLGLSTEVTKYAAVWALHTEFRRVFTDALHESEFVSRPWIWASGQESDDASECSWPSEDQVPVNLPVAESTPVASQTDGGVPFAHQCISTDERIDLFAVHGRSMGDDEVRFHLATLIQKRASRSGGSDTHRPVVVPFECLNFLNWDDVGHILTEKWCESAKQVKSHGHQITAVVLEGSHWLPLWAVPAGMVLVVHTFDDIVDYDIFDGKLRWIGLHLGFEEVVIHRVPHGLPSHNFCGAHALAFLAHILIDAELPDSVRTLDFMATNMRAAFVQAMFERRMCICPLVWGDGGTGALVKSIAEELGLHGVPGALTEQRASQAIKAIGSEQLIQAMQQKQPWRQMKALATNVGFKWVLPSELEAAVAGNKGKPVGKKTTKERNVPGVPPPVEVDPHKLCVLEGTFRSGTTVLPQLCAQQIGPVSSGVVLMTAQEADPYLKAGRLVSQELLALVVFHRADQPLQSMLSQLRVTVPCRCTVDNEPVLAEASLVQIGQGCVEKFAGSNLVSLESPDVCSLRINVFRDEVEDWETFARAPVKQLVQTFPELKRCGVAGCTCPSWHNEENLPLKEPILDLWKRQFMKIGFKPCEFAKADLFCVSLRVPYCLLTRVLNRSGTAGAYVEPRSADGLRVLNEFMVIWAPKQTLRELLHLKQTNPAVLGLARMGERRGLRVPADQAQAVHQVVRPDTLFLPQGERLQYIAGPFPFGLDRQAICKVMKQVGWNCRPLQPGAPQPGRVAMWIVQAIEEPPNAILHTNYGEVLISRHKSGDVSAKSEVKLPVASPATLALCGGPAAKDDDPWTHVDPWTKFKPSTIPVSSAPAQTDSMQQMESRIQAAVLSKLPQGTPMEQDDVPDRLSTLEGQVHQLMQKQTQIDGQFQEFTHHQSQQVSNLQAQMQAQSQQLHGQIETQNQSIQAMFENQLSHIHGLLQKRPRDDGE